MQQPFQLPDFNFRKFRVNDQNRVFVFIILGLLFIIPYLLNNRISYFPSRAFEFTKLELWIPFWDWTVWIYFSDYIFPFAVGYLLHSSLNLSRVCFGFFLMTIVTNLTFFFYPVHYTREFYPLNESSSFGMHLIRELDSPLNCFPSAHVAIVVVTLLALQKERPQYYLSFLIWAILICISTLTTKQHYLVDVIGGVLVGWICFRVSERLIL